MIYGILEGLLIFGGIAAFFYLRARKYKPYYEHGTKPEDFHKHYLQQSIGHTRDYAHSLQKAADSGDEDAIKTQKLLVARLNWLTLEQDFVSTEKPDQGYWRSLNKKIRALLKRWELVKFIEQPPDESLVANVIGNTDRESGEARGAHPGADGSMDGDKAIIEFASDVDLEKQVEALKKQVRNLASYKDLYFTQQHAYREMTDSYKQLKTALKSMEMEAENAAKLRELLASHEQNEEILEQQIQEMEARQERLNAELEQLEAVFNAQLEEEERKQAGNDATESVMLMGEETQNIQEIIEQQSSAVRNLKARILGLSTDPDTRLQLEEQIEEIERGNQELQTCLQMLELERDRLSNELQSRS